VALLAVAPRAAREQELATVLLEELAAEQVAAE